jgi:hypothetical protein
VRHFVIFLRQRYAASIQALPKGAATHRSPED